MIVKRFFYACAAIFLLAAAYHLGAQSATAQAPGGTTVQVGHFRADYEGGVAAVADRVMYRANLGPPLRPADLGTARGCVRLEQELEVLRGADFEVAAEVCTTGVTVTLSHATANAPSKANLPTLHKYVGQIVAVRKRYKVECLRNQPALLRKQVALMRKYPPLFRYTNRNIPPYPQQGQAPQTFVYVLSSNTDLSHNGGRKVPTSRKKYFSAQLWLACLPPDNLPTSLKQEEPSRG